MARRSGPGWLLPALVAVSLAAASCGGDDETVSGSTGPVAVDDTTDGPGTVIIDDTGTVDGDPADGELYPDVVGVAATRSADGTWTFDVTLSSPYDSPDRYADAWRVVGPDGEVYGVRELTHDHAAEQPFTRSQSGIVIPDGVTTVTVEGRDQISGWGGTIKEHVLDP